MMTLVLAATIGILEVSQTAPTDVEAPPTAPAVVETAPPAPERAPHLLPGGLDRRFHLRLDGDFVYGIGGQSFFGAQAHLLAYRGLWSTPHAIGSLDLGLRLAYGNEPTWAAPWIDREQVSGATHRVQALLTVGHTFHMGKRRRAALGMHLHGGLNHWLSAYTLEYAQEGVHGEAQVRRNRFVAGAELSFAYRLSRHVGTHVTLGGPFPSQSSYLVGMFFVGAGLSFYLR